MRIVELHGHSDEMSGLYVLDDGTRIHWSEGRVSEIDVIRPDGRRERHPVWKPSPLVDFISKAEQGGETGEYRRMTPIEEAYHDAIRNTPGNIINAS
jgi:hypothetical protein